MNQLTSGLETLGFIIMCVLAIEVPMIMLGSYIRGKYDDNEI